MTNRNKRTELRIRLNDIINQLRAGVETDNERYALNDEKDDIDIKLIVLDDEIDDEDKAIQEDYEAIKDFNGDWSKGIREKYNIPTHDEVLDIIEL